jgi:hypothetical protein
MYQPEFRANTAAGSIEILPAGTPVVRTSAEPEPEAEPEAAEPEAGEDRSAEVEGLADRKVKTIRVNPDGTIVP